MSDVYWLVLQTGYGHNSTAYSMPFECEHASVEAIYDELVAVNIVKGFKLKVGPLEGDRREVLAREPFAFGLGGLVSIQPYRKLLKETA